MARASLTYKNLPTGLVAEPGLAEAGAISFSEDVADEPCRAQRMARRALVPVATLVFLGVVGMAGRSLLPLSKSALASQEKLGVLTSGKSALVKQGKFRVTDCWKDWNNIFAQVSRDSDTFVDDIAKATRDAGLTDKDAGECSEVLTSQLKPPESEEGGGFGLNAETGWEYSLVEDCYKTGGKCPQGQYCQAFWREQYFPYSEGFINRGRCVPYSKEGMACSQQDRDIGLFGEYEKWIKPPQRCSPELECKDVEHGEAMCAKSGDFVEPKVLEEGMPCDDTLKGAPKCGKGLACAANISVMPGGEPVCAKVKSLEQPCVIAWPTCAGRHPPEINNETGGLDWKTWSEKGICASNRTCMTVKTGGFSQKVLEVCAANHIVGMGNMNAALLISGRDEKMDKLGSQAVSNVEEFLHSLKSDGEEGKSTQMADVGWIDMSDTSTHEATVKIAKYANDALEQLWPVQYSSTKFPLKPFSKEETEKVLGKYHSEYICHWGVMHTLVENLPATISNKQVEASQNLIRHFKTNLHCKVCRTNFAHLADHFGEPKSRAGSEHAKWWWLAHNNANEHVYSVHSLASPIAPRVGDFPNPVYSSPWFTPRDVAIRTWTLKPKKLANREPKGAKREPK